MSTSTGDRMIFNGIERNDIMDMDTDAKSHEHAGWYRSELGL